MKYIIVGVLSLVSAPTFAQTSDVADLCFELAQSETVKGRLCSKEMKAYTIAQSNYDAQSDLDKGQNNDVFRKTLLTGVSLFSCKQSFSINCEVVFITIDKGAPQNR